MRTSILLAGLFFLQLSLAGAGNEDPLPRQAYWGASFAPHENGPGVVVNRVVPDQAADRAGLRTGDIIVRLNQTDTPDLQTFSSLRRPLRGGAAVRLQVLRADRKHNLSFTLPPLPKEVIPGIEVRYDSVVSPSGHRLRTIVARPEKEKGRLPAIFFVPWLSCDSIESPLGLTDGWSKTLHGLAAKSGFVLMRVEKTGLGDSEGPDCSENDLHVDLAGYKAALQALKKYDFVDPDNLFILGGSLGASLAPIVAQDENVRGILVSGGFARTWYEHMLEFERSRLKLSGRTPGEIHDAIQGFIQFYSLYLIGKKSPADVIRERPQLAHLWYDEPYHQFGRPFTFYQQVQALNIDAAWETISAPVLIVYGQYDWIMGRQDQELIAEIVNHRHPDQCRLVVIPGMDHNLDIYDSAEKAFQSNGGRFDPAVLDLMIDWLRTTRRK